MQFQSLSNYRSFAEFWAQPNLAATVKQAMDILGCSRVDALNAILNGCYMGLDLTDDDTGKDEDEPWRKKA